MMNVTNFCENCETTARENAELHERVENGLVAMSIYQRDIKALRERVAALETAIAAVRLVPNKNHSAYFVSVQDANRLLDLRRGK